MLTVEAEFIKRDRKGSPWIIKQFQSRKNEVNLFRYIILLSKLSSKNIKTVHSSGVTYDVLMHTLYNI